MLWLRRKRSCSLNTTAGLCRYLSMCDTAYQPQYWITLPRQSPIKLTAKQLQKTIKTASSIEHSLTGKGGHSTCFRSGRRGGTGR